MTSLVFNELKSVTDRRSINELKVHVLVVACGSLAAVCDIMNPRLVLILQVSIGNPEKMEPITNVSQIPSNRWALICCLCKEKTGACIQVSRRSRFARTHKDA